MRAKLDIEGLEKFFAANPLMSYKGMEKVLGISYQTISKYHKKWMQKLKTRNGAC